MKILFVLTFLANIGLTWGSLAVLPPRVAVHFGPGGMADNWAPGYVHALIMTGIDILLFVSLYFSPHLISAFPRSMINLPHKDYWLKPEHIEETKATVGSYIRQFGAVLFVFLFVLGCLTIHANLSDPVRIHEPTIYAALVALLVYSAVWCFALFKAFKAPKDQPL